MTGLSRGAGRVSGSDTGDEGFQAGFPTVSKLKNQGTASEHDDMRPGTLCGERRLQIWIR